MKRIFLNILFVILLSACCFAQSADEAKEIKQQAIALYETANFKEAKTLLETLTTENRDCEVFLVLSNIAAIENNDNLAIQYLNKALDMDYSFYKAYYNLGCIFASKKSYKIASKNFELAIKYNKTFANAYYNLACCQMALKNYPLAKKNLIKALQIDGSNKDYQYNLAYCYKKLNKPKQAAKILYGIK